MRKTVDPQIGPIKKKLPLENVPIVFSYPTLTYKYPSLEKSFIFENFLENPLSGGYSLPVACFWKRVHGIHIKNAKMDTKYAKTFLGGSAPRTRWIQGKKFRPLVFQNKKLRVCILFWQPGLKMDEK